MSRKDLIFRYGAIARRRFSVRDKSRCLGLLAQDFKVPGYQANAQADKRGRMKIHNLYVGEVRKADTVICADYDTPLRSFGLFA